MPSEGTQLYYTSDGESLKDSATGNGDNRPALQKLVIKSKVVENEFL